jgi:hypothetical protein
VLKVLKVQRGPKVKKVKLVLRVQRVLKVQREPKVKKVKKVK